jgi:hypothetical protein
MPPAHDLRRMGPISNILAHAGAQSRDVRQIEIWPLARWLTERYSYEAFNMVTTRIRRTQKYLRFLAIARYRNALFSPVESTFACVRYLFLSCFPVFSVFKHQPNTRK